MVKKDLVEKVAEKASVSRKDAENVINAFTDVITEALTTGDKVQLVGFGSFEVVERAAREARNPKTGETLHVGPSKAPKFKVGKALKDAVNR